MRAGLRPVIGRANSLLQRQTSAPSTLWRHFSAAKVSPCVRSPRHFTATPNRDAKVTIVVPQMAESISEGTLATLYKQVGDRIEADEEIASIETDKIDITVNAPESGKVVEVHVAEGDTVTVGQPIATMETGDSDNVDSDIEQSSTKSDLDTTKDPIASSKAVEPTVQVDKDTSVPSLKDMPSFSAPLPEPPLSQPPFAAPTASQQQKFESQAQTLDAGPSRHGPARNERVEKLPRIRQTIARRLKESQNRTASLTTVQHVDMSALIEWRKRYKESVMEKHGVRLGYMGAFTKAATLAALQVPAINAYMDMEKETITYRDYVDVSIAVSTPKGLVTPVLRNCESMDIIEMERGIMELGVKVRDGCLLSMLRGQ